MNKSVPTLLEERYNQLKELRIAEDLLINLENSAIATDTEKEFVAERVQQMKASMEDSKQTAEAMIKTISKDTQTWLFMRLRYILGYSWRDISSSLKLSEDSIKSKVYRVFRKESETQEGHRK